jgi:hypothetical protein
MMPVRHRATLEQMIASMLKHQSHQVNALAVALS